MTERDVARRVLALIALATSLACVDAPSASGLNAADDPLAQTFDALARQSATSGDLARSDGFSHAALSVRSGVTPTRIEVRNASVNEAFDAFVTSVDWGEAVPAPIRPQARRNFVAWRRDIDGTMRVLTLITPRDSAPVISPLSLGAAPSAVVFTGASAMYHEGIALTQGLPDLSATWFGVSGWVKIKEISSSGTCPARTDRATVVTGVDCRVARFVVRLDGSFQRITIRAGGATAASPPGPSRVISIPADQQMNGLAFKFACPSPSSATGCS